MANLTTVKTKAILTLEEVEKIIKQLNHDYEVVDYCLKPYSKGKLGYLASHLRLSVTIPKNSGKKNLSFFLKVIPYEVPDQANYILQKGVFQQEAIFFSEILPELKQGYRGIQWVPNCYKIKKDLIVFEDLGEKGYSIRSKLFDKPLVIAALSSIARMHGASLIAEGRIGQPLNKHFLNQIQETGFLPIGDTKLWFDTGVKTIVAIANLLNLDSMRIPEACDQIYFAIRPSAVKSNVISHGDLWSNNLMFSSDSPPNCVLLDYQLFRYCPLAHDVIQLLYLCTSRSFRNINEKEMIQHYYNTLCEVLTENQPNMEHPSWDELMQSIEEQRLGAIVTAALFFPTVLMDEQLGAQIFDDPLVYSQYYFHRRDNIVIENMKKNIQYDYRIKEVVMELAEASLKLDQLPRPA
ncbi:uncharacterized protein [Prorops nasuta]|uniref:uncharacterized protein n=1 Tax=Prorops nasuta TaxID=863751 RepID=UPI0034CD8645